MYVRTLSHKLHSSKAVQDLCRGSNRHSLCDCASIIVLQEQELNQKVRKFFDDSQKLLNWRNVRGLGCRGHF